MPNMNSVASMGLTVTPWSAMRSTSRVVVAPTSSPQKVQPAAKSRMGGWWSITWPVVAWLIPRTGCTVCVSTAIT